MFSIIIPTLNNFNYLKICIDSIKKNSKFNHEIIVHVNVGLDDTKSYLNNNNIKYTFSKENLGLCKSVNMASRHAKHDYIMYSHDDFYFCPNWDAPIIEEIKFINHKKFYLSSTQINTFGIKHYNCGKNFYDFDEKKLLKNLSKTDLPDLQGTTWAPHIVHKDYWFKTNGFSEEFFPGAGSDPDFALKLWKLGVRIFKMIGKSKIYHFESKTLRDKKKMKHFKSSEIGSKSAKIFLNKWGISTKFFRKHYLRSNTSYLSQLDEPKKSLIYFFDLLICKLKLLYLKFFYRSN